MAANTLTLNGIIELFNQLAINHKMVKTFGFGKMDDVTSTVPAPRSYPLVWMDVPNSSLLKSLNGFSVETYTFDIYVLDKLNKGQNNYNDILSDTHYILDTMIKEMSQHKYYIDYLQQNHKRLEILLAIVIFQFLHQIHIKLMLQCLYKLKQI